MDYTLQKEVKGQCLTLKLTIQHDKTQPTVFQKTLRQSTFVDQYGDNNIAAEKGLQGVYEMLCNKKSFSINVETATISIHFDDGQQNDLIIKLEKVKTLDEIIEQKIKNILQNPINLTKLALFIDKRIEDIGQKIQYKCDKVIKQRNKSMEQQIEKVQKQQQRYRMTYNQQLTDIYPRIDTSQKSVAKLTEQMKKKEEKLVQLSQKIGKQEQKLSNQIQMVGLRLKWLKEQYAQFKDKQYCQNRREDKQKISQLLKLTVQTSQKLLLQSMANIRKNIQDGAHQNNTKISQITGNIKKVQQIIIDVFYNKINKFQAQLTDIQGKNKEQIQKIDNKIANLQKNNDNKEENKEIDKKIQLFINKIRSQIQQKLNQANTNKNQPNFTKLDDSIKKVEYTMMHNKKQLQKQLQDTVKILSTPNVINQMVRKMISVKIHAQNRYLGYYQVQGADITYKGDYELTQLLGKKVIQQTYLSAIKVMTSLDNSIGFGIIDQRYVRIRDADNDKLPNYMMYFGNQGQLLVAGKELSAQGPLGGFYAGDVLLMEVKKSNKTVRWFVNDQNLANEKINWVPFIIMKDKDDRVVWVENQ